MKTVFAALFVVCGVSIAPAFAETCPEAPDHAAELEQLITEIGDATTEADAREISNQMWALWTDAPNEQAQALLDHGMSRRAAYDFAAALTEFNRLIDYCPDYAEGYNQRAFVNFLRQEFSLALVDLDAALARSPRHIAALSGKALTLMALDRFDEARQLMGEALEMNPWLPERGLAAPGGPLEPLGRDI